jgi:hypothetical protein
MVPASLAVGMFALIETKTPVKTVNPSTRSSAPMMRVLMLQG